MDGASCSTHVVQHNVMQKSFDEQSKFELLTHIQLFLNAFGLEESAKLLGNEIERKDFVPKRFNFLGEACPQTFDEYIRGMLPFASDLVELIKRLDQLTSTVIPPVISNLPVRLFSSKRQSIGRRSDVLKQVPRVDQITCRRPVISTAEKIHPTRLLMAREFGGQCPLPTRLMLRKETLKNLGLHSRILGHLGPIYCVKFDATGRYIFTGADDNLIKIWDARTCLLRFTFRGHTSYIMDLTISPENTMIASGSMDKTVRVWCLQRGMTLMVYKGHTATISTIAFLPYFKGDARYLVSAGNDCQVFFYRYSAATKKFTNNPIKFNERTRPGSRIMTMCYSPGGNIVVMGDTHQNIRIFQVYENTVERLFQIAAHTDRVDSLVWAHRALRFVSGSKDGTAKVWFIAENGWNCTTLKVPASGVNLNTTNASPLFASPSIAQNGNDRNEVSASNETAPGAAAVVNNNQTKKNAYRVIMLCWTLADDIVISSGSDHLLRTWNWKTGEILKVLVGHTDESFVLLAHPIHKEIVMSVGHDAMLMIWNVFEGNCVKKHRNESDNHEIKAIYDMAISSDGTIVSFADNHGHLSILGLDSNQKAKSQPHEQFFSTDYRPLCMDEAGYVLDELTGLAPQNMDPPFFVNSEGIPHTEEFQRLVPGNDLIRKQVNPICAWVTRPIVPELEDSQRSRLINQWTVISEMELSNFENAQFSMFLQGVDSEHRHLVPKLKTPRNGRVNNGAERRAHIEQMTNLLMNPPPGEPRYVICEEDTDDDSSYTAGDDSHQSDGGDTAGSSALANMDEDFADDFDSDYEEGGPERTTVYRTRTSLTVTGRPKKRRKINVSGDSSNITVSSNDVLSDHSSERITQNTRARRRKDEVNKTKTRARVISSGDSAVNDQYDEENVEERPSTSNAPRNKGARKRTRNLEESAASVSSLSSASTSLTTEAEENSSDFSLQSGSTTQSKQSSNASEVLKNHSTNVLCEYPAWMRTTERRRFPYIAQLGDTVVYFAQGYRTYINTVVKNQLFKIPRKMMPKSDLDVMEVCVVDSIKYISKPYRLTILRLAQLQNERRTGLIFDLMYHDYEGVADFVILKDHYDLSLSYNFKAGDAVEFLLNDQFYTGIVQQRRPLEDDYPSSEWCSVVVRWDNNDGDDEPVCPWDLQPKQRNRKSDTIATKEEMEHFGDYIPRMEDWPLPESYMRNDLLSISEASSLYLERARSAIAQIMEHSNSTQFHHPVDLDVYPDYFESIEYPIDLQTIDERICNKFYRHHLNLLRDIQYLALNARKFNDPKSEIVRNAEVIVETIFRFLNDFTIPNAADLLTELIEQDIETVSYKAPLKVPFFENAELQVEIESKTPNSRPSLDGSKKRSPQSNSPKWVSECKDMLSEIIRTSQCLKSDEMLSFSISHSTQDQEQLNIEYFLNNIEQYDSPQQFVDAISKFLRDFKSFLQDNNSQGWKSRTFSEILNVDSNLMKLSKPIIAKFKRMNSDTGILKSPSSNIQHCELRKKRAAALSAQNIWRFGLNDHVSSLPTTTMNLRNHRATLLYENDCGTSTSKSYSYHKGNSKTDLENNFSGLNEHTLERSWSSESKNADENCISMDDQTPSSSKPQSQGRKNKIESDEDELSSVVSKSDEDNFVDKGTADQRKTTRHAKYLSSENENASHVSSQNFSSQSFSDASFDSDSGSSRRRKGNQRGKKRQNNDQKASKRRIIKDEAPVSNSSKAKRPRRAAAAAYVGRGAYEESNSDESDEMLAYTTIERSGRATTTRTGRAIRVNARYVDRCDS